MSIIRSWNSKAIRIRNDRYVSLTDMAQASDKLFGHWLDTKSAKSYLETLSSVIGMSISELVQPKRGGIPEEQGTWGHPKVALRFAQWCSDDFAVQVDLWIDELLNTGRVELQPQQGYIQPDMTLEMLNHAIQGLAGVSSQLVQQNLIIQQQQQQINQLLAIQQQAEAELKVLPMADTPAPAKPIRAKINEIVRNYCQRNNVSHVNAWGKLYKELYYRCHIDVDARCRNKKAAKLDVVEQAGYMEQLHAIASELLGV